MNAKMHTALETILDPQLVVDDLALGRRVELHGWSMRCEHPGAEIFWVTDPYGVDRSFRPLTQQWVLHVMRGIQQDTSEHEHA